MAVAEFFEVVVESGGLGDARVAAENDFVARGLDFVGVAAVGGRDGFEGEGGGLGFGEALDEGFGAG